MITLPIGFFQVANDSTGNTFVISGTGFNASVISIVSLPSNKFLVVGQFSTYNSLTANRIKKFNQDGSFDNTFSEGSGIAGAGFFAQYDQFKNKYYVVGTLNSYNGNSSNRAVRINANGTFDNTFPIGTGFNSTVFKVLIQPDGKTIFVGSFSSFNGNPHSFIVRLNADDTLDTSFNNNINSTGPADSVGWWDAGLLSDGSLIVIGQSAKGLAKFSSSGIFDSGFDSNIGTGLGGALGTELTVQPFDDRILIGGNWTSFNGSAVNRMVRLNSNGSRDFSFNIGTGFNGGIDYIKVLDNGKICVGGMFSQYQGVTVNRFVILLTNGNRDTTYIHGTGFDGSVFAVAELGDDSLLIGGGFITFKGTSVYYFCRITRTGTLLSYL